MITITNSVFDAQGAERKDKVYGITLKGYEDILIKDCTFQNKGYASILNHSAGKVVVDNCVFECENVYNPIEGSQSVNNGDVTVKNCEFLGAPGNNYINFYQVADNSKHEISDCSFAPSVDNNVIRVSNRTSAPMQIDVKNCEYNFAEGEAHDYTGFVLCQDYTSKSGVKQDFTKVVINLENVVCDGSKVSADGAAKGSIFYVYEDGKGIITGEGNDPVVTVK